MPNELSNAVVLLRDAVFRDWVMAASCYQATGVLANGASPAASKSMATEVLLNPAGPVLTRLVSVLATRQEIASVGTVMGEGTGEVGQSLLLTQMNVVWAPLAAALYPQS